MMIMISVVAAATVLGTSPERESAAPKTARECQAIMASNRVDRTIGCRYYKSWYIDQCSKEEHDAILERNLAANRRWIELEPNNPAAHSDLGRTLATVCRWKEAKPELEIAVAAGDKLDLLRRAEARWELANCLWLEGDKAGVKKLLTEVAALEWPRWTPSMSGKSKFFAKILDDPDADFDMLTLPHSTDGKPFPTPQEATYGEKKVSLAKVELKLGTNGTGGTDRSSPASRISPVSPDDPIIRLLKRKLARFGTKFEKGGTPVEIELSPAAPVDKPQGYSLDVANGKVSVKARTRLGLTYGVVSLIQCVDRDRPAICECEIRDWPRCLHRAAIDYWVPSLVEFVLFTKMTSITIDMDNCTWSAREYSLSPLDRERHRLCAARLNEFGIKPLGYTGQITIRPLLPLSSPRTWKLHLSWAKFLASIGMGDAFLLDDNRYPMHPLDIKNAGTGAKLDAKYVTKLYREVKKDYPDFRMAFCPPFYWGPDSPASYPEPREPYLKSVGEFLDPEISVAWTGGSVKTKNVTREKAEWYSNLVGRKPILCQNSNCIGKHSYTQYGADSTGFKESHSPDTFDFVAGFNQNMTHYGEGSMVASAMDWCWNPDAHDGTTSVRRALDMFEGPGVYDVIVKGTDEISYFDKYEWGKPRIELLGEDLAMLERRLAAGEEAWSNAMKIAKNGGEFMCGYKDRGLVYARNLVAARRNPSESLLKEREAVNASVSFAKNEAGFDEARGDEFIPGALLFGGTYAENMGDWTKRGLRNVKFLFVGKTLSGGFSCEPFPPPKPFVMNICARSCDAKEKGTYEVEVNGRVIWRGEAFIPYYYTNIEVEIPVDAIKRVNTFKIRNASPPKDDFRKALFHYVVIKKGVDK